MLRFWLSCSKQLMLFVFTATDSTNIKDASDVDVSVDALITILQDPDTGVPRPSVSDLANVRLRNGEHVIVNDLF